MKKIAIILITVIFLSGSCEEKLDFKPKDVLTPEIAEKQLSTFQGLINNAYNILQIQQYYRSEFLLTSDALADNVVSVETRIFDSQNQNNIGAHFNIWDIYVGINHCNLIIEKIGNVEPADSPEETIIQRLKAESYFLRALMYFDLHRVYSYEPNNIVNNWDVGMILRTLPVTNVKEADLRKRSSIETGYRLIESDLLTAITIFNSGINNNVYRANLTAAHALLGRLYLYWGRWGDAIAQTTLAKQNTSVRLVAANFYEDSFTLEPHPESLFELDFHTSDLNFPDKATTSMRALTNFNNQSDVQFYSIAIPDDLINAFEEGDIRRNLIKESDVGSNTYNMAFKWLGSEVNGENFIDNVPIIRYAELLLIEAEAHFRLGDEVASRTALSTLRMSRNLGSINDLLTGNNLFNLIMNERRVEFFLEGHRWFDLKRNGMDISKDGDSNIPFNDFRILANIPFNEIVLNQNLAQNPGY